MQHISDILNKMDIADIVKQEKLEARKILKDMLLQLNNSSYFYTHKAYTMVWSYLDSIKNIEAESLSNDFKKKINNVMSLINKINVTSSDNTKKVISMVKSLLLEVK